jgi:hypothetical protein
MRRRMRQRSAYGSGQREDGGARPPPSKYREWWARTGLNCRLVSFSHPHNRSASGKCKVGAKCPDNVCGFLDLMAAGGIRVWLDGGWAVDASLGSQTRPHSDLDIVIEERHVERLGYDDTGRKVDFHVIVLDE